MAFNPKTVTTQWLIERYSLILIDAYGVLVTSAGAIPGAAEFIASLEKTNLDYYILTNDCSRTPERAAAFYSSCGIEIPVARVLTPGLLIRDSFARAELKSPRCAVLGTEDTVKLVADAGGQVVAIEDDSQIDALVIGDDSGFEFLPTMNRLLSSIHGNLLSGARAPKIILPNPDLLYPRGGGKFGFTSGAVAHLLAVGLERLHPETKIEIEVLGKPERHLFDKALALSGRKTEEAVMLGDQLQTDVLGAHRAGIASCWVLGEGLGHAKVKLSETEIRPQYILNSFSRPNR